MKLKKIFIAFIMVITGWSLAGLLRLLYAAFPSTKTALFMDVKQF